MKVKFVCLSIVIFLSSCSRESEEFSNSINISVPYELNTLDPHAKDTVSNFAVLSNCYEPLVRTDANMKAVPALASSWESPDLNTWVFHLQKGVRFHSGKPLTTEDVVYSFERLLKDPNLEMKSYITSISEVKGINKSPVIIRTTRPVAPFLNKLNFVHIIPKDMGIGALAQKIDGTGPYKLVEWKKGTSIQITRNERY